MVLLLTGLLSLQWVWANDAYYGREFHRLMQNSQIQNEVIKSELFRVLSNYHIPSGAFDEIVEDCPTRQMNCERHTYLSYKQARRVLFGKIHLKTSPAGYSMTDEYCSNEVRDSSIGPDKIPNHHLINTEHTWPQSKFSTRFSKSLQKSDLHGLYPVSSRTNSQRSNYPFAEVVEVTHDTCVASRKGRSDRSMGTFFEPPDRHKGNVARAMFYFSIRYQLPIDSNQEHFLRRWHLLDPIDPNEIERNEEIFGIQKIRNPFIDYPELVSKISNF